MGAERMQREFASQSNVAGAFLIVAKTRIVRHEIYSSASATPVTQLEDIIRSEIGEAGAISFARFMELALYHPSHGYYERHLKQTGRDGDFFTSVNVGSLYGELLAVDFARRQVPQRPGPAHRGRRARWSTCAGHSQLPRPVRKRNIPARGIRYHRTLRHSRPQTIRNARQLRWQSSL